MRSAFVSSLLTCGALCLGALLKFSVTSRTGPTHARSLTADQHILPARSRSTAPFSLDTSLLGKPASQAGKPQSIASHQARHAAFRGPGKTAPAWRYVLQASERSRFVKALAMDGDESDLEAVPIVGRRAVLAAAPFVALPFISVPHAWGGAAIDGLEDLLRQARKDLAETDASDPDVQAALEGQEYFLERQLNFTKANAEYLERVRENITSGRGRVVQSAVLVVQNITRIAQFLTESFGMKLLRKGPQSVIVGFGPESLDLDDGGCFSLELVQATAQERGARPDAVKPGTVGGGLKFIQLSVPYQIRVGTIYRNDGVLLYGYGCFDILGPENLRVRAYVGRRREPFEAIGVGVPDPKLAAKWYVDNLGATRAKKLPQANAFVPKLGYGAEYISFGPPEESVGIFLLPEDRGRVKLGGGFGLEPANATAGPALGPVNLLSRSAPDMTLVDSKARGGVSVAVQEYEAFAKAARSYPLPVVPDPKELGPVDNQKADSRPSRPKL